MNAITCLKTEITTIRYIQRTEILMLSYLQKAKILFNNRNWNSGLIRSKPIILIDFLIFFNDSNKIKCATINFWD